MNIRNKKGLSARIFEGVVREPLFQSDESVAEKSGLFGSVDGGKGDAEAGGAAGDGGVADGGDEDAFFEEPPGGGEGGRLGTDGDGDDGAGGRPVPEKGWRNGGGEAIEAVPEFAAALVALLRGEEIDGGEGGGGGGRGRRGGKDETAGAVDEEIDDVFPGADVAAADADGFTEGSHEDVDLGGDAFGVGEALAVRAEDADCVGFIDEEHGAVAVLQFDDFEQRGAVAIHAEDRLGDDEDAAAQGVFAGPGEVALEFAKVIMGIDTEEGAAEEGAIDEGGVAEFVEDDDVFLAKEGA